MTAVVRNETMPGAEAMTIGEAARTSGVSAKMIRHYETIGLIPQASRTEGNYRLYSAQDVHALRFIRRARDLGFPLLSLWRDRNRASGEVKSVAMAHVETLDRKIRELEAMRDTLRHLAAHCQGDARPDCPILDDLARSPGPGTEQAAGRREEAGRR